MTCSVTHVTAYYPPHLGGQENLVQGLAHALSCRGWLSDVVTSNRGAPAGRTQEEHVTVTRLRSLEFGNTAIMPALLPWLVRRATEGSIIHLHVGQAFVPEIVQLASKLRRYRYVVQMHTDLRPSGPVGILLPAYRRNILSRVLRDASAVVVMNLDYDNILRERYLYRGPVSLVRNGIADEWFDAASERSHTTHAPVRLLYIGRLGFPKNCAAAVDAVAQLPRGTVSLTIVGTGPDTEQLRTQVSERRISDLVRFAGALGRSSVIERMREADAVVIPSLYESSPLVLFESLAAGIPIIATAVLGLRDQATGCVLECDPDPSSIADAIRRLTTTPRDAMQAMTLRGRELAARHRWTEVCSDYEDLYLDVLRSA